MVKKILKIISIAIAFILVIGFLVTLPQTLTILRSPYSVEYKAGYISGGALLIFLCFILFKFGFGSKK